MSGEDLSGQVLEDRYELQARIAEGAMGVVYRGSRISLDRAVAIKVMHASLPAAMEGRKRFEREAKLMAKLEHPHCVSIIDYGLHGAKPYVVMELVRGRSLYELLDEQGQLEIPRAVDVMRQVLSGLAHAHEEGIIHRDIKPANIMVTPKAPLGLHVRILDFGLARMLEGSTSVSKGVAVGTPSYMAPEQCRGDEVDTRVDIYACGVVLFEMLTGRKPIVGGDPISILKKQLEDTPPKLSEVAPGDFGALEDVVARALAKKREDRFPSAVAMAEALDAAVTGRGAPERTAVMAAIGTREHAEEDESVSVPITVGSSVTVKPPDPGSSIRRQLPVSRTRWLVLAALLFSIAAVSFVIVNREVLFGSSAPAAPDAAYTRVVVEPPPVVDAPPPKHPAVELADAANKLAEAGKVQAAITSLVKARQVYRDSPELALALGKLYMGKMWWNDGVENLRDAITLDPTLRKDPDVIRLALQGFLITPSYDDRLGRLLLELGEHARPALEDTAKNHRNPASRARAEALLRRMR